MDGMTVSSTWVEVCRLDDIPRQGARVVAGARGAIALFRSLDDQVFALDDRCPHKGGPLSQGIVHGHAVTCPLHNWTISLQTGQAHAPDQGCSHTIPSKTKAGRVFIAASALPPR